jgi:hypothetical protein
MSTVKRCQERGRRLSDVLFCPQCGEWFCCIACLAEDKARHLRSNATGNGFLKPDGANSPGPTSQVLRLRISSRG